MQNKTDLIFSTNYLSSSSCLTKDFFHSKNETTSSFQLMSNRVETHTGQDTLPLLRVHHAVLMQEVLESLTSSCYI